MLQKSSNGITTGSLRWIPQGHYERGWPKNMSKRTLEEMGKLNMTLTEIKNNVQDRAVQQGM